MFGTHVFGRADHEAGLGDVLLFVSARCFRDAEVHDLSEVQSTTSLGDHDVVGLQVTMHDAELMGRLERLRRLARDIGCALRCQRALTIDQVRE